MASLSTLSGLTFSAGDYADQGTFSVDYTQFLATGALTVNAYGPGELSNADVAAASGQPAIEGTIASVDTADATSYRLGTVMVNDIENGTVVSSYTADIIGINSGQVLLGIGTYDPTNPTNPYNNNYALLSDTSLSQDPNSTTTYSTSVSNTNPNAYEPPCFVAGTGISTPDGEVAVETIRVGDLVLTHAGESKRVIWTGSRRVDITRHPRPETVRPIRIEAGAFDDNVPSRDLLLSPDHSVHVDGVLIPVKCLVNGRTITQLDQAAVSYHHIELAQHDVVLANGLPAETYLDTGNRLNFAGQDDAVFTANPDFATIPDLGFFIWESSGYARLVLVGPELDAVRGRLAVRAERRDARKRAA